VIRTGTTGSVTSAKENGRHLMNGKGDKRRPEDRKKIEANWDKIFGKPKADKPVPVKETKT